MCGIIGYVGKREAASILMDGLSRMEYRGYDSAGLAVVGPQGVARVRVAGKLTRLYEKMLDGQPSGKIGIAHTRWATHGEPSEKNAHPHADCKKEIFIVHNGIIENFRELRSGLKKEGHRFASDTDSEIFAHLIEKFFNGDLATAVKKAVACVKGAYGLAVASSLAPATLVAAKFGSPLVLGLGEEEFIVASDVAAVLPVTRDVIYLEDGELAEIRDGKLTITNSSDQPQLRPSEQVEWTVESAQRQGFPHFMQKEIFEQPDAIVNSMRGRLVPEEGAVKLGGLVQSDERLRRLGRLTILGMGTARHAGLVGEYMLEEYAGMPVEVDYASEYAYRKPLVTADTGVMAISQSGETADTILALKEAKRKDALVLGIVNVVGSSVARLTDAGVYNHIGPEISVASTKAFTSQLTVLALLTIYFGRMRQMSRVTGQRIIKELEVLPELAKSVLGQSDWIKTLAEKYARRENFFFLGRKYNYPVALEGALKAKEIAYVHAEGYNGGEMKHGPIALIEKGFPVVVIAPSDSVYEKTVNHIQELKVRGAEIIAIATEGDTELRELADEIVYIPKTLEMLTPILSVIPLQLFAYHLAVARGCDVDKPRNLAKSVTVE